MKQTTIRKILAIGAATGMRSMAGVAALSLAREGRIMPVLALGEMALDKTPLVGDRVDALPLAGRALLGALVGVVVAREHGDNAVAGGLLGAASAVVVAHLAYQARKRMPLTSIGGGLVEDVIVLAITAPYASARPFSTRAASSQAAFRRQDDVPW